MPCILSDRLPPEGNHEACGRPIGVVQLFGMVQLLLFSLIFTTPRSFVFCRPTWAVMLEWPPVACAVWRRVRFAIVYRMGSSKPRANSCLRFIASSTATAVSVGLNRAYTRINANGQNVVCLRLSQCPPVRLSVNSTTKTTRNLGKFLWNEIVLSRRNRTCFAQKTKKPKEELD